MKGEGSQGPLLEEIEKPKQAEKEAGVVEEKVQEPGTSHLNDVPESSELAAMPESVSRILPFVWISSAKEKERNTLGATLKDRGNKLYSRKDFQRAVEW